MTQPKLQITSEEYLAAERKAEHRHEYYNGEIFAMAGASRTHNRIVSNLMVGFGSKIKGGRCEIYANDLRVRIEEMRSFVYPDIVITCGDEEYLDDEFDTLLNPVVIIEVLSESTAQHDMTTKFSAYRRIPSLQEYLMVAQERVKIEHFARQTEELWTYRAYEELGLTIRLESVGVELSVEDVYAKVNFEIEE
ncbi:MAG: Uma2 family endonuclease [Candidatus Kapaibacterium sp.]